MQLALTGLFQARWTEQIHDEWTRSVLATRPDILPGSLARCRQLMDAHVPDCLIAGYEALIPTLTLPDPNDRHVLAAAIHGCVGAIVTFNLSDFPAPTLEQFAITALHPDEFITQLYDEYPDSVLPAIRLHRASLKSPPTTPDEYLAAIERCQLPRTATRLRPNATQI
jgi:hypothetical protein